MPLPKLNAEGLAEEGYGFEDGLSVLRAKLSAGPSRTRLDMIGAPIELSAVLYLDPGQYQYWRSFFRSTIKEGSLPFRMDLIVDSPDPVEHEVKLVPGSTGLGSRRGNVYQVPLRLEVKPDLASAEYDDAIVMLYSNYGDGAEDILNRLAQLVNVEMPAALG